MSPLPHAVWLRWKGEMSLKEQKGCLPTKIYQKLLNLLDEHFVVDEANWTAKNRKTGVVTNESIRRLARVP
jgi:hypothetical protein